MGVEVGLSLWSIVGSELLAPEGQLYKHLNCGVHVFKVIPDVFAIVKPPTVSTASRFMWTGTATQACRSDSSFLVIVSEFYPALPPRMGQMFLK